MRAPHTRAGKDTHAFNRMSIIFPPCRELNSERWTCTFIGGAKKAERAKIYIIEIGRKEFKITAIDQRPFDCADRD